jgi:hypothetical protein
MTNLMDGRILRASCINMRLFFYLDTTTILSIFQVYGVGVIAGLDPIQVYTRCTLEIPAGSQIGLPSSSVPI